MSFTLFRHRAHPLTILTTCLVAMALAAPVRAAVGTGTAPIMTPSGGFAIDGDLGANQPTPGIGDWVPGAAGSGGSVLTAAGVPIDPANTFHLTDAFSSGSDDNFVGGLKFDDNPNGWSWTANPVSNKTDINNGLLYFTHDAQGHVWVLVGADRLSNKGDAYIDFEFLQKPLTVTGTPGIGGGFSSAGTDGGRTVNDFILTLSLTQGGSTAGFFVERWESVGGGLFDYVDRTTIVPANAVFAAVNTAATPVSFGAFGTTTYPTNTFVEGAVDLTSLIAAFDPCLSLGVSTMFVKTKTSQSPTATITDFIAPLQVSRRLGVVDAGADQLQCPGGSSTTFALQGSATPAPGDVVSSTLWTVVGGAAMIDDPTSLATTVHVTSAPATLRLTVSTSPHQCVDSDDVVLALEHAPSPTLVAPGPLCTNGSKIQLDGQPAGGVYSGTGVTPSGSFDPSALAPGSYPVTYTATDPVTQCAGSVVATIVVSAPPTVTLAAAGPLCTNGSKIQLDGQPAGGSYSGTGVTASGSFDPSALPAGSYLVTYSYADPETHCANQAQRTIAVNPPPTVTLSPAGPLCSNGSPVQLIGTPAGGTYAGAGVGPLGGFDPAAAGPGSHPVTYTYMDPETKCTNVAQQTIVVNAPPSVTLAPAGPFCSSGAAVQLDGQPTGGSYSGTGVTAGGSFDPSAVGPGSYVITYTFTDPTTQCTNSVQRTIAVNPAATANAGPNQTVCSSAPTTQLAGAIDGGASSGTWVGGTGTFNPGRSALNATYTPSAAEVQAGSVTLTLKSNDPDGACGPVTSTVTITFAPAAIAHAGPDQEACADHAVFTLAGSVAGAASSGSWSGGSGSFSPGPNALGATYTASSADIAAGSVMLVLTTDDPAGPCGAVTDTVVLTIDPLPSCDINGPSAIAIGETATLCGPTGNFDYAWNTGATTRCIQVTDTGTYTLTTTDRTTHCVHTCVHPLQVITCACTAAYPDSSSLPRSLVSFNESEVLAAFSPGPNDCVTAGQAIHLWYEDEHALTLGVRRILVKTASGTMTTDYPITATPAGPTCVDHPQFGATGNDLEHSGNDVAAGGGRPLWPALFYTDLTANGATSRLGDWQQGGTGTPPHRICGTWKAAVRTVDETTSPATITVTPDQDPAKNSWNLGGGDDPPGGSSSYADQGYSAECIWYVDQLGLVPGHVYRFYFMLHDGDQNKTGGDAGQGCTTVHIPQVSASAPREGGLPLTFQLAQNVPNPFRSSTTFRFALPERSAVRLAVYDLAGRQVASVVDGTLEPGEHQVRWSSADVGRPFSPGVYLLRLSARGETSGRYQQMRKMILIR